MNRFFLFIVAAAACTPEPPLTPQPPEPPPHEPAIALSAVASAPAPVASNATPPPKSIVLGKAGDIVMASYPPIGFEKLSPQQRALAYHLAMAAMAGDPLFTMQTSKAAWPVTELVMKLLAQRDKLDPAFREKLVLYRRMLFVNHGLHDTITGQKTTPPFAKKDFEAALQAASLKAEPWILAALFDPKVLPNLTNKTPGKGKDPILSSAANHYEGVSAGDLKGFKDTHELNSRVVKEKGKLVEQIYRVDAPGIGSKELARVVKHLDDAIALAPAEEQVSLKLLRRYFQTGDVADFTNQDIAWLKQVFSVDYIFGFVETYTDVREKKGGFEAFVAIADPERDPPLQQVAKNAQYFEKKMPWKDEWKRDVFNTPAAAAVRVLAATGDAGPMTFLGVNLPNQQELRQKYGSKNFVVLSVDDTREEISHSRMIDEFAPEDLRREMHRCARYISYALTAFHEVTGHGSGKVAATLKADPSELLAPYYATMEEGRAELVADYLSFDPKTLEIGLLPDAGCQKVLPSFVAMETLMRHRTVPEGDVVEEDHFRADLIQQGFLADKGLIKVEVKDDKTYLRVTDVDGWVKANGELLAEHQRIKATADKGALKALVEKYGIHLDTKRRDEVRKRLAALDLPRAIATIPPILTPVLDDKGRVVDAKAEQTTSIDRYLDALEASWKD